MAKLLNLTDEQRKGCRVTFNVNRFEVYAAAGWLMTAASTCESLEEQLWENKIEATFDPIATQMYEMYKVS